MSSQVQKEIKLTLITEIPAREFYVPFPFSPLPDLLYYLAGDEDENVVNVYQAEKVTN